MDHQVEDPVGEDRGGDDQRRDVVPPRRQPVDGEGGGRPEDRRDETVGVRHVVQIEGVGSGEPRHDPHLLDTEQDERRPGEIQELHRDEQHPQRDGRVPLLRRETHAVVPDEHGDPPRPLRGGG